MALSTAVDPLVAIAAAGQYVLEGNSSDTTPPGEHAEEHSHPYYAFLFLCMALILGALTLHVQSRCMPSLPYTCALLVEGGLVGYLLHRADEHHTSLLSQSTAMWADIDPHLLLYIFLPALLFADTMQLNWHKWKRCFGQCAILACPGVVVGALLQGVVAHELMPYGWSWSESIMFGSILGATDPVAVVSIMKELGAPPSLTMMVSGESLMNDGTAIVMFNLFAATAHNTKEALEEVGMEPGVGITTMVVVKYFFDMAIGGAIFGIIFGLIAVLWIGYAKRKTSHSDGLIQITVILVLPYVAFVVCEQMLGVSGIIAVVAAGLVVAACGWPQFVDRSALVEVWHVIEYILNTLIFLLAGVIIGDNLAEDVKKYNHISLEDLRLLGMNYVLTVLIRFVMVGTFFPVLRKMGYGISCREAVVLAWGGLRGAVGLALALDVDISFTHENKNSLLGSRVLFHVSGIAVLTLLVNGIMCTPLLKLLGLSKSDHYAEALLKDIHSKIADSCKDAFKTQVAMFGNAFTDDLKEMVKAKCRALQDHRGAPSASNPSIASGAASAREVEARGKLTAMRQLFLHVLRNEYLSLVERGILSSFGQVCEILYEAVDVALDRAHEGLFDFEAAWRRCSSYSCLSRCVKCVDRRLPRCISLNFGDFVSNMGLSLREYTVCYLLRCFIQAHTETQTKFMYLVGQTSGVDTEEESQVVRESTAEVKLAQNALDGMAPDLVKQVMIGQVAEAVLECERRQIVRFLEDGALDDKQAHHLLEEVEEQMVSAFNSERKASLVEPDDLGANMELSFARQSTGHSQSSRHHETVAGAQR